MDQNAIINKLLAHRAELEQLGVRHLSIFGSTSRGTTTPRSDVDLAVILDPNSTPKGLAYIGRLDAIETKVRSILGSSVDIVPEPARKADIQAAIDRDRVRVY